MTYTTLGEFNQSGLDGLFLYVVNVVPTFIAWLLFAVFMVSFLASYAFQREKDFLAAFAISAWFTSIITFVLMLTPDLVNPIIAGVVFTVTVIASAIVLLNR